jgi:FkbM family methyltransferase
MQRRLRKAYRRAIERFTRSYVRRELPGWGRVYKLLVGDSELWNDAGKRTFKDKVHGFEVELDLGTWSDRITYFLGRYYDLPTQLLLLRVLRRGDHVFDVGANVGHLSLLMARRVGETGRVDAFEPNPAMFERLTKTVKRNAIRNLFVHDYGLGTEEAEVQGSVPLVSPGEATFTPTPYAASEVRMFTATIRPGDAVTDEVGAPVLVKIDVEGFECKVVDGLQRSLKAHRPIVITEVMPDHLARAGETAATLFERMLSHGYEPRRLFARRDSLRSALELRPVTPDQISYCDVVWFDPANRDHVARLQVSVPKRSAEPEVGHGR